MSVSDERSEGAVGSSVLVSGVSQQFSPVLALPCFAAGLGFSFWLEFVWLQPLGLPCLRNATRIACCDDVMGGQAGASCREPLTASPGAAPESLRLHQGAFAGCWELLMGSTSVRSCLHNYRSVEQRPRVRLCVLEQLQVATAPLVSPNIPPGARSRH